MARSSAPKADALPGCATPRPAENRHFEAVEPLADSGLRGNRRQNAARTGGESPDYIPNRVTVSPSRARKSSRRSPRYAIPRTCERCGIAFTATKNPAQRHCSTSCRFWSKVVRGKPSKCWEWTGTRNADGYGMIRVSGRWQSAHRLALILRTHIEHEDLMVIHSCDNPPCCNPKHLRWGTAADNAQDAIKRGRFRGMKPKGKRP